MPLQQLVAQTSWGMLIGLPRTFYLESSSDFALSCLYWSVLRISFFITPQEFH